MKATKKLFALLLAFSCLFLTACNNNPAASTAGTETTNSQNQAQPNETELKDTIIFQSHQYFFDLPSRVLFHQNGKNYYYSKADGQAYVYCFDPLCEHTDGYCLADPDNMEFGILDLNTAFFINNRFYITTLNGIIVSFSFDGMDKKIEYDAGYDVNANAWSYNPVAYGKYIYISLRADEKGNPHTLRFNTETGEMEDLTEKTGNYIEPSFFYNGEIYGYSAGPERLKSDLDLNYCEETTKNRFSPHILGSCFFDTAFDDNWNGIGIQIYDMKTGEIKIITNETIGVNKKIDIVCVDENYIYFYQVGDIYIGDFLYKDEVRKYNKGNDGSIYRINHDGSGLICIYEEDEFEITGSEAVISGNQFLIKGQNIRVRDLQVETWDSGVLVGTISADGKIDELKPVEVVE